jgi:hypothetical protein
MEPEGSVPCSQEPSTGVIYLVDFYYGGQNSSEVAVLSDSDAECCYIMIRHWILLRTQDGHRNHHTSLLTEHTQLLFRATCLSVCSTRTILSESCTESILIWYLTLPSRPESGSTLFNDWGVTNQNPTAQRKIQNTFQDALLNKHLQRLRWDRLCGQSSWLQFQRSRFDSRRYQIFWQVVGLLGGQLCLVSITEELHECKSSGSTSRKLILTAVGIRCADHATLSIHKSWY